MGQSIRPLTVVSLDKLAAGIASAVTELTNEECTAQITRIDFESKLNAWMDDTTMVTVRLSLPHWWLRSKYEEEDGAVANAGGPSDSSEAPQG